MSPAAALNRTSDESRLVTALRLASEQSVVPMYVQVGRRRPSPAPHRVAQLLFGELTRSPVNQRAELSGFDPALGVVIYLDLRGRRVGWCIGARTAAALGPDYWRGLWRHLAEDLACTHHENALALAVETLAVSLAKHFPPANSA